MSIVCKPTNSWLHLLWESQGYITFIILLSVSSHRFGQRLLRALWPPRAFFLQDSHAIYLALKLLGKNWWPPSVSHLSCLHSQHHMNGTANLGCELGMALGSIIYFSSRFCMLWFSRRRKLLRLSPFTSWKLGRVGSSLRALSSLFRGAGRSLSSKELISFAMGASLPRHALAATLKFLVLFFSPNYIFCISFCLACFFFSIVDLHNIH